MEGHRMEDDEPLCIPAALPDSCEFCGQSLDEAAPDSPAWRVIPPCEHDCQGFPAGLPRLVILDPPTEVLSIVGVHPLPVNLYDPPVLPCGNIPGQITCGPLSVQRYVLLFLRRSLCRRHCVYVCLP